MIQGALRIGVDVGGTNTDAVLVHGRTVVAKAKRPTTANVTGGIQEAVRSVLDQASPGVSDVAAVMLGTTHFVNALLERKRLTRVAVLRFCGPATTLLPPFCDWPVALREAVGGRGFLLPGGHEFDGREISTLDEDAVRRAVHDAVQGGADALALCGIFSPVNPEHEERAEHIVREAWPDLPVTLSHEIGRVGLLERENAAALNAALSGIAGPTVDRVRRALEECGFDGPLFFSQNDGTVMDAGFAVRYPVLSISSGPTNSMRGAALLSGEENAIVVDVGGTTTDVGVLVRGFPRTASAAVEIAGVRTNFRMPDLLSIALGGGSLVRDDPLRIGPESVGARLTDEALVFGGDAFTATDAAVAAGFTQVGNVRRARELLDVGLVERAVGRIHGMLEEAVDRVRITPDPLPLILVGGGSILLRGSLSGASRVLSPDHAEIANAIGAAIAQVGGEVEAVFDLERETRDEAMARARADAVRRAVEAGAAPSTVDVVEVDEVPLTYLPGNATRIRVKAVGDLGG